MQDPRGMTEKCLRNSNCTCSTCAGFDVASLMSISKSISSNIEYENEDGEGTQQEAPPAPKFGGVANSPIPAPRKAFVSSSPPLPATRSQPQATEDVLMDVIVEDVAVCGAAPVEKTPAVKKEAKKVVQDINMDAVATAFSNMKVVSGGPEESVSLDEVLPKLTDKNWKARKEAFEELKTVFEQPGVTTERARPAMGLFSKMCEDSNASAMEAGIAAVLAYTLNVQPFEKEIVSGVMARMTDKGFSARPGIVKLCEELVDAFIAAGAAEETVIALLEGTSNRKPKVPPACLTCTLEALKAYGPRVVPLQAIKSALPKLMEGAVKVRQISMDIMVEIHRWTGPALVQDVVANLRSAQQTEFEGQVKDVVPGQAAPTKFVKGAKPAKAAGGGNTTGASSGAADPASAALDPRDFTEIVDLLAKLPKTEFKTKLALPKWSEKVEALNIVLEVIGPAPKLSNGDYYELVSTLKVLTNDSNVNIVAKSIEVFGALADGLRKNFTQYARTMFPDLLRKLSDKKSVILSATNKTLDLLLQHAMPIDMMMNDLKLACDASKNKAPPARVQTMAFVARAVENRYVDVNDKALIVAFGLMFMKGVNDTNPKVREAGQKSFIVLLTATDQTVGWLQSQMDEIARKNPRAFKTIQRNMGGSATSAPPSRSGSAQSSQPGSAASSRPGSAPPSRPSSAGGSASRSSSCGSNAPVLDDEDVDMASPAPVGPRCPSLKKRGPPARLGVKPGAAPKAVPSRRPLASGAAVSDGGSADFTPMAISVTAEEAEGVIADLQIENWGPIQEGFSSSKWMERKEAIEGLEEFSKAQSSMMSMRIIEAFTVYLSRQVKDFKDSNINVLKSSFQAVGTFAKTAASKFPRGVACLLVPRACDKIGDRKANEAVTNMIMQFCEATSPSYTTGCMIEYMPQVRTPLAHIEALKVLSDCVKDFGVSICNPRALIDFAKGPLGLESSNPTVRSAAISLLSTMYSQLGPALLPILNLESWKPALAAAVESEFKKVGFDPTKAMATVKRQVKGQDEASGAVDPGALFGRVDVSGQITKELLGDMKNESDKVAWKKRAEAMDTVQSICESAGCTIEFTRPVQEVLRGLKARLNDSNANLKVKATNVIAIVATSVGPDIAKMSKILGASLIAGVADNKKTMQAASIQALHKWVCHNNETSSSCMKSLLNPLSEGLANTVGRAELLGWASEHLQNSEKLDLNCLVVPTVQCMMDKSSEAREKAQLLLVEVMKYVGKDTVFTTGCRDIKPAAMRALKPLLQKICKQWYRARRNQTEGLCIDLLNARLKHLPASSLPNGNAAPAEQEIAPEQEMFQQQQRTDFGSAQTPATTAAAPTNISSQASEGGVVAAAQPIAEPTPKHEVKPHDDDIGMNTPNEEIAGGFAITTIQVPLLDPIKKLVDSAKQIVRAGTPAYKEGGNALKGLYAIISQPSDLSEVKFLNSRVNDITIALCDAIHGAFYAGGPDKRPEMFILVSSIATLTAVFNSDVVTNLDRSVVERVLLELCSKIMDDRMVKFSDKANLPDTEISAMSPEDKRYLMVFKSLYKAICMLTERARPGDVYPSVINLLQRLLRNDVGDYNKHGSLKHLQAQDSLDQLVGRILLKLSSVQANSLHPFEGIDICGVLMQMQTFFSTLPKADAMLVNIANDYMRQALKIMSDSLMKSRPGDFEESMKAIPPTSQRNPKAVAVARAVSRVYQVARAVIQVLASVVLVCGELLHRAVGNIAVAVRLYSRRRRRFRVHEVVATLVSEVVGCPLEEAMEEAASRQHAHRNTVFHCLYGYYNIILGIP
ncbi:hypothetical protein PRIC2_006418 [Phytophthora ramorum]